MGHVVDSIFGGGAGNAASAAANQAAGAENDLVQKGILPIDQTLLNDYQTNYAPVQRATGSTAVGLAGGTSNLGPLLSRYMNTTSSPGNVDAATGINGSGIVNNALNFYGTEANQGLDPQFVNSALAKQEDQQLTNINTVRNSLGGSLNNPNGTINDMNMQDNNATLSLLGNLAAENQSVKNNAVQSMTGLASTTQQNDLANMLSGISTGGTEFGNLLTYLNGGTNDLSSALGSYNTLTGMYQNAANSAAQTASNAYAADNKTLSDAAAFFF